MNSAMMQVNPVNKAICLEWLCESNYRKLLLLIPDLLNLGSVAVGKTAVQPDLQLDVIERSTHTLTIRLNYRFNLGSGDFLTPEIKVRVYRDVQLAEVLCDCVRFDVARVFKDPGKTGEILDYKWRMNYFLGKWLDHCLQKNYRFPSLGSAKEMLV